MKTTQVTIFTLFISLLTIGVSFFVAYHVSGSVFGKSRIVQLADFGALTTQGLANFEFWRFIIAQLIHVHQKHMIYNVLAMFILGWAIEREVGYKFVLFIWLFAGAAGTFVTTQIGTPPWNIGTGSSQAIFGLAGFGFLLAVANVQRSFLLVFALAFALFPALYLDFRTAGYPKLGHITAFVFGWGIACYYIISKRRLLRADNAV